MYISTVLFLLILQYGQGKTKTCFIDPASHRIENAALKKPATQISTYKTATASKAVDGNTNPHYVNGSCMHTHWQEGLPLYQWWMVDLEREYRIDSVNITNRLDFETAKRQRDFDIFVSLNSTFEEDDHMADQSLCNNVFGRMGGGETRTFPCQMPVYGQYVQIYMETLDGRDMNICEVTVKGYEAVCIEDITTETSSPTKKAPAVTSVVPSTTTQTTPVSATTTQTTPVSATTTQTTPVSATTTQTTPVSATTTQTTPVSATTTQTTPVSATTTQTTPVSATTTQTTPVSATTTQNPTCLCACGISSYTINLTQEARLELVKELQKELTVNKKETSISKKKLISVGDERQSAETIGYIGVLALCVPVLIIFSFDLINLWSSVKQTKKKE